MNRTSVDEQAHGGMVLVEQYKLLVDSSLRISVQRQTMNRYYFTVVSALYTLTWVILTYDGLSILQGIKMAMVPQGILFAVSLGWRESIKRYSCQAELKTALIEEMEEDLPSAPFTVERRLYADENEKKPTPSSWEEILPAFINKLVWLYIVALGLVVLGETWRDLSPYWGS